MIVAAIKCLAIVTFFAVIFQYFLYATNKRTHTERRASCLPLGIFLFVLAIAGFATRDVFLVFLSVVFVALSLWLGPTTWRGKPSEQ